MTTPNLPPKYKIHPAIGIARLGNSPNEFYIAPETTGGLPIDCDSDGQTSLLSSGAEQTVSSFKDANGLIKRQAARFRIYVYDDINPEGREIRIGDEIVGNATRGKLVDIKWTAYLANKKSAWYEFQQLQGEHGYDAATQPLRNAAITMPQMRQNLVIDPGPQSVALTASIAPKKAEFAQGKNPGYAQNFPPVDISPNPISTLGEMMSTITDDKHVRLLLLGGHGNSGTTNTPRIDTYANNDGWFDDISDGPVTATLIYFSEPDQKNMSVQVSDPSWVIVGYPRYAPEITDMVTMDDVVQDMSIREFGSNPYLYGPPGTYSSNKPVEYANPSELLNWRRKKKQYNPDYYPLFFRDIWPVLKRPYYMQWTTAILGISNAAHEIGSGGDFYQAWMATPPDKESNKDDNGPRRKYVYSMLRLPGEENQYYNRHVPEGDKMYDRPMMPMLCGSNPITNTLPDKFLTLTNTQLFMLKQWANGKFINEESEDFKDSQPTSPPRRGEMIDRGVLGNALGGAFCPGAETAWIIRNPAIFKAPYRINGNPSFLDSIFMMNPLTIPGSNPPPQISNGLEPGDLTKYGGIPWQSDFNECSSQTVDITYDIWNVIDASAIGDPVMQQMETDAYVLWWPSHRPMQVYVQSESRDPQDPKKISYGYTQAEWSRGIPQTHNGDLKMVTEWSKLGFLIKNVIDPNGPAQGALYIESEYTGDVPADWSIETNNNI